MAIREFDDEAGGQWIAIELRPELVAGLPSEWLTAPPLATGWLAFQGDVERRRLSPIPDQWWQADVLQLREMLAHAWVVPTRQPTDCGVP